MQTKMTMQDIKNTLRSAYSMAKYTGKIDHDAIVRMKQELASRTPSGRRRYPSFMQDFASGYDSALFDHMITTELECFRRNVKTGVMYTTDKSGRSKLDRIPDGMHREVAIGEDWESGMRFIETGKEYK